MQIGYARVSSIDQHPEMQLDALKKAGCEKVFKDEGISGATAKRPGLVRCLKSLQEGDRLSVWKLDRLARSLRDLVSMALGTLIESRAIRKQAKAGLDLIPVDNSPSVQQPVYWTEGLFSTAIV
jgi:predicted site-specific integrase-resolvase